MHAAPYTRSAPLPPPQPPKPASVKDDEFDLRAASPSWKFIVVLLVASVLLAVVLARAEEPTSSPPVPTGMVFVPGGEFVMGADNGNFDEAPQHRVRLSSYFIDRHEVTVAEFNAYVRSNDAYDRVEGPWFRVSTEACVDLLARYEKRYGVRFAEFRPPVIADKTAAEKLTLDAMHWKAAVAALRVLLGHDCALADRPAAELADAAVVHARIDTEAQMPVRFVTWRDASAYAHWAGKRLPTEAEWEKAARGTDGRTYPWGSQWNAAKARAGLGVDDGPTKVAQFADGASPYGCVDMAGNVWEWCEDWYGEFYYRECADGIADPKGPQGLPNGELPAPDPNANYLRNAAKQGRETDTRKVVRGGCWAGGMTGQTEFNNRCSRRLWSNPNYWSQDTGFRCVKDT